MFFSSSPGAVLYDLGQLYVLVLLARAVLSWFPPSYNSPLNPLRRGIYVVTEPVLAPFRKVIPPVAGLDLSFIVAFFVVEIIVQEVLARL